MHIHVLTLVLFKFCTVYCSSIMFVARKGVYAQQNRAFRFSMNNQAHIFLFCMYIEMYVPEVEWQSKYLCILLYLQ